MMRRVGSALLWLALGTVLAVALMPLGRVDALGAVVAEWEAWLAAARLAAIGALWLWWDRFAGWAVRTGAAVDYLRGRRHFYAGCLVAVELVIVQNVAVGIWDVLA